MKNLVKKKIAVLLLLAFATVLVQAQIRILDGFDSEAGWNFIRSDAVNLKTSVDKGISGNAIRFDYDFTKGTGYGGIQKFIHVDVPDNYEFTFYVKADSPANNFEIKFIDSFM